MSVPVETSAVRLPVSPATYAEIKAAIEATPHTGAIRDEGRAVLMTGFFLVEDPTLPTTEPRP